MQYYQECIALGSKTGLSIVSSAQARQVDRLYQKLWKTIFLFERRFSRFLPGSELSTFNRNAGLKQAISPEFRAILTTAIELSHKTGGLYNPFVLPALQAAGYTNSRVPGHGQDAFDDHSRKSVVSIDKLEIGDDWARIPYGTALDLGGCGKGYLADLLRSELPDSVAGYWLSFGGDIAVDGLDEHGHPWTVTVQSADDQSKNVATLSIAKGRAVATSGTIVHRGKKLGKSWHHIIDPRTRQPAETDVLLATVYDDSTLRADVLASCAIILGSKEGLKFLKREGVEAAVLQYRTKKGLTGILHFGSDLSLGGSYA